MRSLCRTKAPPLSMAILIDLSIHHNIPYSLALFYVDFTSNTTEVRQLDALSYLSWLRAYSKKKKLQEIF